MKKCLPFILFTVLTCCISAASALTYNTSEMALNGQEMLVADPDSSYILNKSGEPVEFFNGFSFGASAGLGLFHGSLADYDMLAPVKDFDDYYKFAWRIYAQREIKWGLIAKLQFEAGKLTGGRLPGKESLHIDFETEYKTISGLASFDLLNSLFNKEGSELDKFKFYINAELGIGLTMYRSLQHWSETGVIRDFVGYTVADNNPGTQRYSPSGKDKQAYALNIPVGFTAGYRLNYKTDITFNYTLNNLMTNNFDAFDREYRANDKYSYFGLGLRYNFNRNSDQYPKKKVKEPKPASEDGNKKWLLFGSKKDDVTPKDVNLDQPVQSRKSNGVNPADESQEMKEIRMKMFELQLKLFEMQYLLNGGQKPPAPAKK